LVDSVIKLLYPVNKSVYPVIKLVYPVDKLGVYVGKTENHRVNIEIVPS